MKIIFVSGIDYREGDISVNDQAQLLKNGFGASASVDILAFKFDAKDDEVIKTIDANPDSKIVLFSEGSSKSLVISTHLSEKKLSLNNLHINEPPTKSNNILKSVNGAITLGVPVTNVYSGGTTETGSDIKGATLIQGRTSHLQSLTVLGNFLSEKPEEPIINETKVKEVAKESAPLKMPDFPPDKIFTFNVEKSGIITNPEIGTFSIIPSAPEYQFETIDDQVQIDEEYIDSTYMGEDEQGIAYEQNDLSLESLQNEKETLTGEEFDIEGDPSSKSGKSGSSISINSNGMSKKEWEKKGPVVNGSKIPGNIANPPKYNSKVSINKTIKNEYIPVIKGMSGYTAGIKLLAIVMAQKEGFSPKTRSYRTNNPGNIGNTDSGSNKKLKTLEDGIQLQLDYIYSVAKGKKSAYPLNVEKYIKPYYSPEIAKNNGPGEAYAGSSAYLPGYKFIYTGKIEQFVKIYSTGSRHSNSYITMIVSWFRQNGFEGVTEETTLQELISLNKPVDLLS